MHESASLKDRMDALERRVAQQDQVIDELSKTVTGQWRRIDGLVRQVAHLTARLKDLSGDTTAAGRSSGTNDEVA